MLNYLVHIWKNVIPRIVGDEPELMSYIYGNASSLESNDVLHSMISLGLTKNLLQGEYKQINKKAIF